MIVNEEFPVISEAFETAQKKKKAQTKEEIEA